MATHPSAAEGLARWFFAAPTLGLIGAGLISGTVVERLGVTRALVPALAGYALCGALPLATSSPAALIGGRVAAGIAAGFLTTCSMVLAAGETDRKRRERLLGLQTGVASLLAFAGALAAGPIAAAASWPVPFLGYAVIAAAVAAGVPLVQAGARTGAAGNKPAAPLKVLSHHWRRLAGTVLLFIVPIATGSNLAFVLTEVGRPSPIAHSIAISAVTSANALGAFPYGWISRRLDRRLLLASGLALTAGGLGAVSSGPAWPIIIAGAISIGLGFGLWIPLLWSAAAASPPEERPVALGLTGSAMFLGGALSPPIVTAMAARAGATGAFFVLAVALALSAIGILILGRLAGPASPQQGFLHD